MADRLHVDSREFRQMAGAFQKLPTEIKAKAFGRAMRRVTTMSKTKLVRRSAERVDIPQKHVRQRMHAAFNAGANSIDVVTRSGWIPLYKLGARQTRKGVSVKLRGSYRHAFIATMASGHTGVFRRDGSARIPISELFGPNPANDMVRNSDEFLDVMVDVAEHHLAPRLLHELTRLLPD